MITHKTPLRTRIKQVLLLVIFTGQTGLATTFQEVYSASNTKIPETESQMINTKPQTTEIKSYDIQYHSKIQGYDFSTSRKLQNIDGAYTISQISKTVFLKTFELSRFSINISNSVSTLVSNHYYYKRKVFGKKKTRNTEFFPENMQASYKEKGKEIKIINTPQDILDQLNFQLQFRIDLIASDGKLSHVHYQVLDEGRVRDYEFRRLENEWIYTDTGYLETLKYERIRKNKNKHTIIWLAKNYDYILVKISHSEKGKVNYELNIVSGEIAGVPVTGHAALPQSHSEF